MMNDMFSSDVPQCWICHDEGIDESGQPLRRDCSCRGSASGFAHLSCLVENAKFQHTTQWDGRNLSKIRRLWGECPSCKQWHQNKLRIELATEFVSFVEGQYPNNHEMLITALHEKLISVSGGGLLQEAKNIANRILSLIDQVKTEHSTLPRQLLYIKARTYYYLGIIDLTKGTKEDSKEALIHYEKCRDLSCVLGLINEVAMAERDIDIAKEKCGEVISKVRKVETSQKLYDSRLKLYGEEAIDTLVAGKNLAISLLNARRLAEAESLLEKLVVVSKQVHGLDHRVTKRIQSVKRRVRRKQTEREIILAWGMALCFLAIPVIYDLIFLFLQGKFKWNV